MQNSFKNTVTGEKSRLMKSQETFVMSLMSITSCKGHHGRGNKHKENPVGVTDIRRGWGFQILYSLGRKRD